MKLGCWLVCFSLVVSLMLPQQRAEAVVVSASTLGSLFGLALGTYGYSWAVTNMNQAGFSNEVYNLLVEWKTETTEDAIAAINALMDLAASGVRVVNEGRLWLNQKMTQAVSAFADWFSMKYMSGVTSATIASLAGGIEMADGSVFELSVWDGDYRHQPSYYWGSNILY